MKVPGLLRRTARAMRAAWLAIGAGLALLLVLEAAYRAQAAARHRLASRAAGAARSPAAGEPWRERLAEEEASTRRGWRPFVYYRRLPYTGRHINVDSLGHRWTPTPPPQVRTRAVLMFGGSPLWGGHLRDSSTIPARVAAELPALGVRDAAVTNLGEAGYVLTQEVIELLLQLRAGARPAVVVFYDGYNDVEAALKNGHAGATTGERDRERDFRMGHALFPWRMDLGTQLGVAYHLSVLALGRLQFVARLTAPSPRVVNGPCEALADDVARTYLATVDIVEALADYYGFAPYYALMPSLDTSDKPLSTSERAIIARRTDAAIRAASCRRLAEAAIARRMADAAPGRFAESGRMFAAESATVFLDDEGHMTDAASARVATELARDVAALLGRPNGVGLRGGRPGGAE